MSPAVLAQPRPDLALVFKRLYGITRERLLVAEITGHSRGHHVLAC